MRKILFRGKRIDNGEWIYGDVVQFPTHGIVRIVEQEPSYKDAEVDSETVGQYTGLTDKNGKKIFEGDVIRVKYSIRLPIGFENSFRIATHDIDYIASVIFDKCRFYSTKANGDVCEIPLDSENIEIIGNIHDNPELLEVK